MRFESGVMKWFRRQCAGREPMTGGEEGGRETYEGSCRSPFRSRASVSEGHLAELTLIIAKQYSTAASNLS